MGPTAAEQVANCVERARTLQGSHVVPVRVNGVHGALHGPSPVWHSISCDDSVCVIFLLPLDHTTSPVECLDALISLTAVVQKLKNSQVIIVTRGTQVMQPDQCSQRCPPWHAGVWGFARTMRQECPHVQTSLIDLDGCKGSAMVTLQELMQISETMLENIEVHGKHELEIAYRGDLRLVPRLEEIPYNVPANDMNSLSQQHNLVSLTNAGSQNPADCQLHIRVHAIGVVLTSWEGTSSTGSRSSFAGFAGNVVTGIAGIHAGSPVYGIGQDAQAKYVTVCADWVHPIPLNLDFIHAAALPAIYLLIHRAFSCISDLQHGQSLLLYGASGAIGCAAVHYAQSAGLTVHVACSTDADAHLLGGLGVPSTTIGTEGPVFEHTLSGWFAEQGVDTVINLAQSSLPTSVFKHIVGAGQIVQFDQTGCRSCVDFLPTLTIHNIVALPINTLDVTTAFAIVAQHHAADLLPSSSTLCHGFQDLAEAMGFLQNAPQACCAMLEVITTHVRMGGTYLVTGGLGGIGLSLIRLLVELGATHVAVASRSSVQSIRHIPAAPQLDWLHNAGTQVLVLCCDVASQQSLDHALELTAGWNFPIHGIIHAAGVIDDALISDVTPEQVAR